MDGEDDERIPPKTKIPELFKAVDENKKLFIDDLKEAVSIQSISNSPEHFDDIIKMFNFCTDILESFGATVNMVDGNNETSTHLPPVLFAHLFGDDDLQTICVYGNIDVFCPDTTEDNKQSPFEMTEKNGRLYGCGISDNKAALLCWFNALKIYKMTKNEIPVNIKFVIEGTSELYSRSLSNAIKKKREFFSNVEYICLTIDKRINEKPCLKYGYRGLCLFGFRVSCGEKRVHSGNFGGAFNQPMMDAINIVGTLLDQNGKTTVTEFLKDVRSITKKDEEQCKKNPLTIESIKKETGVAFLEHKEKLSRIILHKTRLPSFTLNAFHIKVASADTEDLSSIPNKIEAKFSVRLVPNQKVDRTFQQFKRFIDRQWNRFKSANSYELTLKIGLNPWMEDPSSNHYEAAATAIKTVYKVKADIISEGSTIPVVSIFNDNCPASNIIVMPISGHEDCHHTNSESISINNYTNGVKLTIAYMCEVHELHYK